MKLPTPSFSSPAKWLRAGKTNLLVALIAAVGMIAAVSIFASGGELVHSNCPQPVVKWAYNLGWKNPDTFTCKPDFSKHKVDALPGSVAEKEFSKIKNTKDLKQFLNSNNEKAELFRKSAKQAMDDNSYKAWLSGDYFVMVQFKKPAVIKGNSYLVGNKIEYNDSHLRPVPAGDILFVFVDPTKKQASLTDEAADAVAGVLPQAANAAQTKYSPLKVNINPNLNVEIKVGGDCKGDNTRRPGADGSITFPNCATGNHNVTVDNQITKDGKTYKARDNQKQVNVPNQGSGNVTFTYDQISGGNPNPNPTTQPNQPEDGNRGQVKVNINPNINVAIKISGDCKGDNIRNTGPDGSITFKNCTPGKHTVTVDKNVIVGDTKYKIKDTAQTVTVKKGKTEDVTFKYEKNETVGEDLQGSVNALGNIRLDCGNVRIIQIYPRDKQVIGHLKIVKFEDKNGNGKEDKGEPRMKNVQFKIDGVGLFETDKNGEVEIKNLDPDKYTVKEVQTLAMQEYKSTTKDSQQATVKANKTEVVKFGNQKKENTPKGKIKIIKFNDKNGNGKQDADEPRMKGVEFKIEGVGIKKTNKNGVIIIDDLPVGKKVEVKERLSSLNKKDDKGDGKDDGKKDDKKQTAADALALMDEDSDADLAAEVTETASDTEDQQVQAEEKGDDATWKPTTPITQTATSAAQPTPILFGNTKIQVTAQTGALLIGKAIDANNSGQADEGDTPQKDVTFTVTGPNNFSQTVKTAENGFVGLTNLTPGEYKIVETVPAGYEVITTNPLTVTVQANQIAGAPFLNRPQTGGLLIGKAVDANGNGQVDASDTPQKDITFTVTGPNNYSETVTTNDKGLAGLTGLVPGVYSVVETVPAGYEVISTNPQNVTVEATKLASAPFLNKPTTPETPETPKTPGIVQAIGNLPKTGQAGLILLATFLAAAGTYYGARAYKRHKKA